MPAGSVSIPTEMFWARRDKRFAGASWCLILGAAIFAGAVDRPWDGTSMNKGDFMSIDRKTALVVLVVILLLVFMPGTAIVNSAQEASFIRSTATYKRIKAEIDMLRVIDNHEHLPTDNIERKRAPDFFDLVTVDYTGADTFIFGKHDRPSGDG